MSERLSCETLPGMPRLFLDLLSGDPGASRLVGERFASLEAAVLAARSRRARREQLAQSLLDYNARLDAPAEALENAGAFGALDTFAVVTGQQAGLLCGPAYTVYKALTAVHVAALLTQRHPGLRFVPVFWIEDDDDDLAEATTVGVYDRDGSPLKLGPVTASSKIPVGRVRVSNQMLSLIETALGSMPAGKGQAAVSELVRASYTEGRTLSDAFALMLLKMLGGRGLVMVSAQDPAFKALSSPAYCRLIAANDAYRRALVDGARWVKEAGYKLQAAVNPERAGLFCVGEQGRSAVTVEDGLFWAEPIGRLSQDALQSAIASNPTDFTADVLSRPLVQDMVLPTAAFVAGPNEMGYHAQLLCAYQALDVVPPAIFPRASLTILEPWVAHCLAQLDISAGDVLASPEQAERRAMRLPSGETFADHFDKGLTEAGSMISRLSRVALELDPSQKKSLDKSASKINYQLSKIESLTLRVLKQKEESQTGRFRRILHALLPWDDLQERRIGLGHYLSRSGFELLDRIMDGVAGGLVAHGIVSTEPRQD